MSVVVDTNVLVVANGAHDEACLECVESAIDELIAARSGVVAIDDGGEIFSEYRRHASHAGQPGTGDSFFKWLWDNQGNPSHCQKFAIHENVDRGYQEFPPDDDLQGFDWSDRKFVAVAISCGTECSVLNASDTDWWQFRDQLLKHNVNIIFICPELMK